MSAGVGRAARCSVLGHKGNCVQEKCLAAVSVAQGPASLAALPQPCPRLFPSPVVTQRLPRLQAFQDVDDNPARARGRPRKTASPVPMTAMPESAVEQQPAGADSKSRGRPRKTSIAPAVSMPPPAQQQAASTPAPPGPAPRSASQQQHQQEQEVEQQPRRGRPRKGTPQVATTMQGSTSAPAQQSAFTGRGQSETGSRTPQLFDDDEDIGMVDEDFEFLDEPGASTRFSSQPGSGSGSGTRGSQSLGLAPARSLSDRFSSGPLEGSMPRGQSGGASFLRTPQTTEEDLDAGLQELELQGSSGTSLPGGQTRADITTQRGAGSSPTGLPYGGVQAGISEDDLEKAALRRVLGIDIYERQRREQEPAPQDVTSHLLKTGSARDFASARLHLTKMYWQSRRQERDAIHMAAWAAHHGMREKAVNVYANVRRIAGLMSAFEEDDFRLREEAPSHIAPWARSELVFREEYPEFQEYLRTHSEEIVKMLPKEADDEELDLMDEALFLMRPDDEDRKASKDSEQTLSEQHLMDHFLEGTLPGATLNDLAATYADDIFKGDEYQGAAGLDEEGAGAPALDDPAAKQQPAGVEGLGDDDFGIEGDDADDLA